MRRIAEIGDRMGDLFNGDFHHVRRDVLAWATALLITRTLDEVNQIVEACTRVCLGEAIIRCHRGEVDHTLRADAKLTEYLWLLGHDLTTWFHTEPGEARFQVAADLLGVPLPVG